MHKTTNDALDYDEQHEYNGDTSWFRCLMGDTSTSQYYRKITSRQSFAEYVRDIVRYAPIIGQITYRNIMVRYKQSLLGLTWALLEPLLTLAIFLFVFGTLINFESAQSEVPFALTIISGLIGWQLFSINLTAVGDSLIAGEHILKKIYFPRIILCIGASLATLLDFVIMLALFVVILLVNNVELSWRSLLVIPISLQTYLIGFGSGLIISTLNVKFRDFKHIVPLVLKLGFYLSPVPYTLNLILGQTRFPEWMTTLYLLNPMVGAINAIRWVLFDYTLHTPSFIASVVYTVMCMVLGVAIFFKREALLADEA